MGYGSFCVHESEYLFSLILKRLTLPVLIQGVLKSAVCWDALQSELHHSKLGLSNICQILKEHDEECTGVRELHNTPKVGPKRAGSISYEEAMKWMAIVLDYWTHLRHFSIPSDPRRTVFVTAKHDKYVPREWAEDVRSIWPGNKVLYRQRQSLHF